MIGIMEPELPLVRLQPLKDARFLRGFTLIELLVVISIIILVSSMAVIMLPAMLRGEDLKGSAMLVRGTLTQVRQLACAQRIMHFILFDPEKSLMSIYQDSNENEEFDIDIDEQIGEPVALMKGIIFVSGPEGPSLFRLSQPYLGFRSDGSIMLPPGVNDSSFPSDLVNNPLQENSCDIVLAQKGQKARIFIDIETHSGISRKMWYKPK